jgi:hypothetical protein
MHRTLIGALFMALPFVAAAEPEATSFNADAIRAHVRFLSDDLLEGRGTGTRGYDIAATYVASWLEGLGLEPAGAENSFFQPFETVEESLVAGSARVSVSGGGDLEVLESPGDYLMSGSYVDEENLVTGPVTFVGFGVSAPEMGYDDLAGMDLEGHVVLLFSGAPESFSHDLRAYYSSGEVKYRTLAARGVSGVIALRTRAMASKYSWDDTVRSYGFRGMRWVGPDGRVKGVYPGLNVGLSLSRAGLDKLLTGTGIRPDDLYDQAESGVPGSRPLGREIRVERRSTQARHTTSNVAAILPGADPALRDEYVAITAHLDHIGVGPAMDGDTIYNGAYDNATGIAVMLEVARALAGDGRRPARSVMFLAVSGEEQGLLGSDYYSEYPSVPIEHIVANVNLDMPLFIYPLADVVAFGAEHSTLDRHVSEAAGRAGLELSPDPMPEEVLFIRSDQYSFVKKGIPAIFFVPGFRSSDPSIDAGVLFTEFLQTYYHKPSDDLSLPFLGDAAEMFTAANYYLIRSIADAPERPAWKQGDFFGKRFGRTIGD